MGCGVSKEAQLYDAVKQGNAQLVHKLLKAGVSFTGEVDGVGSTLLHVAGQLGYPGVIDELCEVSDTTFIAKRNSHCFTALHEAAINGHAKAIMSLLEGGADVNCAGPRNNTPLHLACSRGNLDAVKTLVANGADLNAIGQADERPLHVASRKGRREICMLLVELGADPCVKDSNGNLPWQVAAHGFTGELSTPGPNRGVKHSLSFELRPENIMLQAVNEESRHVNEWLEDQQSHFLKDCDLKMPAQPFPLENPEPLGSTAIHLWQSRDSTILHLRLHEMSNIQCLGYTAYFLGSKGIAVCQVIVHTYDAIDSTRTTHLAHTRLLNSCDQPAPGTLFSGNRCMSQDSPCSTSLDPNAEVQLPTRQNSLPPLFASSSGELPRKLFSPSDGARTSVDSRGNTLENNVECSTPVRGIAGGGSFLSPPLGMASDSCTRAAINRNNASVMESTMYDPLNIAAEDFQSPKSQDERIPHIASSTNMQNSLPRTEDQDGNTGMMNVMQQPQTPELTGKQCFKDGSCEVVCYTLVLVDGATGVPLKDDVFRDLYDQLCYELQNAVVENSLTPASSVQSGQPRESLVNQIRTSTSSFGTSPSILLPPLNIFASAAP